MQTVNTQFVTSVLMNTNITSSPIAVNQLYGFSIQAVYTSTSSGTLKLQASADPFNNNAMHPDSITTPTHWTDIADSSATISGTGTYIWNINGAFYNYVRLVFTDSSSGSNTGRLTATLNGKY